MRAALLALPLAISACVAPAPPSEPIGFVVLRCNEATRGGRFDTVLNVRFANGAAQFIVGEDGLTRQIAFDAAAAVAYVRAQLPGRTTGLQGAYNSNCGRERLTEGEEENDVSS